MVGMVIYLVGLQKTKHIIVLKNDLYNIVVFVKELTF